LSLGLVHRRPEEHDRRYAVLETIRAMVPARLGARASQELQGRHAAAMLAIVGRSGSQLDGPDGCELETLLPHRDNVRQALTWAIEQDPEIAAAIVARLGGDWFETGTIEEGLGWCDQVIEAGVKDPAMELHVRATQVGLMTWFDLQAAVIAAERLRSRVAEVDDATARTRAIAQAALSADHGGDPMGPAYLLEALVLAEELGFPRWIARLQLNLALTLEEEGDQIATRDRLLAAIEAARVAKDDVTAARALGNYAVFIGNADLEASESAGRRALALLGNRYPSHQAWILSNLADTVALRRGPGLGARELKRAIELTLENRAGHLMHMTLSVAPSTLIVLGHTELAARAIGLTDAVNELRAPNRRLGQDDLRRKVRMELGEVRAAVLSAQGREEDPAALLQEILATLDAAQSDRARNERTRPRHAELTKREVEILRLIGEGRTDAEIGETLFISRKTVSVHLSNAKAKLGIETRLEAALWARERGLVEGRLRDF